MRTRNIDEIMRQVSGGDLHLFEEETQKFLAYVRQSRAPEISADSPAPESRPAEDNAVTH